MTDLILQEQIVTFYKTQTEAGAAAEEQGSKVRGQRNRGQIEDDLIRSLVQVGVKGQRSGLGPADQESGLVLGRIFISVNLSEYCQPVQLDHSTPSA